MGRGMDSGRWKSSACERPPSIFLLHPNWDLWDRWPLQDQTAYLPQVEQVSPASLFQVRTPACTVSQRLPEQPSATISIRRHVSLLPDFVQVMQTVSQLRKLSGLIVLNRVASADYGHRAAQINEWCFVVNDLLILIVNLMSFGSVQSR